MELKNKVYKHELGDVFERHQSPTLWCPVCYRNPVLSEEYAVMLGVGGQCFVRTVNYL